MKRIFAKRFLTVLAFLFAFALLINANVAKANAEETGATVTTEPVSVNEKIQEFIDAANALEPECSSWEDKYYDDTAFLKKVEVASKLYAGLTNAEIEEAYKQSDTAQKYYEFVVVTKGFQAQIEVSNAINALTGRVNGVAGYDPINEVDRNTVASIKTSYKALSRDAYVKQTSDPAYIDKAMDEVEKCHVNNEAAIAAIKNIEYLLNGAMEKDASGEIVLKSKDSFKAAEDAMAKVAVRDYVMIKESIVNGSNITTIDLLAQFEKAKADFYELYDKITATKDLIIELHDTKAVITNETIYTNRADILKLNDMYEELQALETNGNGFNDVYQELLSLESGLDTKYDSLIDAYNDLLAEIKKVEDLIDVLDGIADADIYTPVKDQTDPTSSCYKKETAREEFDALPQDVKDASEAGESDAVENYADLVAFEKVYQDKVDEIEKVDAAIVKAYNLFKKAEVNTDDDYKLEETLGNVNKMYTDLSANQKIDVTKVTELEYCRAVSAKNSAIANEIDAKIEDLARRLPTAGIDPVYISEVEDVRAQYEALTESQKAYVKKEPTLKAIEDELALRLAGLDSWYEAITDAIEACYDENGDVALVYGEGENYEKVVAAKNLWEPLTTELKDAATSKYPTEVKKYNELVAELDAKYDAVDDLANRMAALKELKYVTLDVNDLDSYVSEVADCTAELQALGTFAELLKEKYADAYENYVAIEGKDAKAAEAEKAIIDALWDANTDDYKTGLTIADANDVEDANDVYEALTDEQKAIVRNYKDDENDDFVNTLKEALAIINEITKKLEGWIENVEALVESTKKTVADEDIVVVDLSDKGELAALENEWAAFNADEKGYKPIAEAKAKLDEVRANGVTSATDLNPRIQAVIALTEFDADDIKELNAIKSIYEALTESQQKLVNDYEDKFLDVYQIVVIIDTFEDLVKELDEVLKNNNGVVTEEMVIMVKIVKSIYAQHDLGSVISKEVKELYESLEERVAEKEAINVVDSITALKDALEAAENASSSELSAAKAAIEAAYAAAIAEADEELKAELEKAYKDAVADAKADLEAKLATQKTELEKLIAEAKALAEKAATAEALKDATDKLAALEEAYKAADSSLKGTYDGQISTINTKLSSLEKQIKDLESALEAAKTSSSNELSDAKAKLEEAYKAADEDVKAAYTQAVADAKADLEAELATQKAELEKLIAEAKALAEKAATAEALKDATDKLAALEEAYKAADSSLKGTYDGQISTINTKLSSLEKQIKDLESALEAAKTSSSNELSDAKAKLEEAYKAADEDVKAAYTQAVADAKADLEAELATQKAELEDAIKVVKEAAATELADAKAKLEEAYKNADSSLQQAYEQAVADAKAELQTAIDALKAELEAAKAQQEEKNAKLDQAISDLEKSQKTATIVICVVFGLISAGLGTCVFLLFKRKVA